ncbi:MAG: GMC oxidoreductase [Aureliella sp.]
MKVLIVGAGPAGVTLARRILESNQDYSVEMVEAGPRIEQGNSRAWLDFVASDSDPFEDYEDVANDQEEEGERSLNIVGSRYIGAGGSTNAWGGWCLRYRPEDFHLHTNTGEGIDWPFEYSVLEPFYERAENTLWVAGTNKPNPPLPFTLKDGVIIETFQQLGVTDFDHLPLARSSECVTIGTCKYCPILKRYIPHLDLEYSEKSFSDRFKLQTGMVATAVRMRSKSKCAGVLVQPNPARHSGDCKPQLLEANIVVLALGAIETPKLLLASQTKDWPTGVGNDSDHVGRHITAHPLVRVVGMRQGNPDNMEQPVDFPTLMCREFDTAEHQKRGKLLFVRDGRRNYVKLEDELASGKTLNGVRNDMRKNMPFELRGFVEVFSEFTNRVELAEGMSSQGLPRTKVSFEITRKTKDAIKWAEKKLGEILSSAGCEELRTKTYSDIRADHATSTCRMSLDDSQGVVDENLRVHGTDNLFICSNAVLPNGAAVNPTLTLIALTERLSDHISQISSPHSSSTV